MQLYVEKSSNRWHFQLKLIKKWKNHVKLSCNLVKIEIFQWFGDKINKKCISDTFFRVKTVKKSIKNRSKNRIEIPLRFAGGFRPPFGGVKTPSQGVQKGAQTPPGGKKRVFPRLSRWSGSTPRGPLWRDQGGGIGRATQKNRIFRRKLGKIKDFVKNRGGVSMKAFLGPDFPTKTWQNKAKRVLYLFFMKFTPQKRTWALWPPP